MKPNLKLHNFNATPLQLMLEQAKNLLIKDGWQEIENFDDVTAFVFTIDCEIVLRHITWDSEYSEWHDIYSHYPCYWLTEKADIYNDVDDWTVGLLATTKAPLLTENTKEAIRMIQEFEHE